MTEFQLYQLCHILKIPLVIDHFWTFFEIQNLTETSKKHKFHLYSSLLTIKFWFSTLKFSKLQIFYFIWKSILKILQFLQNTARWKFIFWPPSKGLQGPSLMGHKSKITNCTRLKICILYTHTTFNHWQKIQKNLRWWFTWVGWLDMELPDCILKNK